MSEEIEIRKFNSSNNLTEVQDLQGIPAERVPCRSQQLELENRQNLQGFKNLAGWKRRLKTD